MPKKSSSSPTSPHWIVQLYFVLASLLGLAMLVIGSSIGLNALLTQYIFTPQRYVSPPARPFVLDQPVYESENLTVEQQMALTEWQADYDAWQTAETEIDYETESRKRSFATALGMILVGLPVFLIHAPFVFQYHGSKMKS